MHAGFEAKFWALMPNVEYTLLGRYTHSKIALLKALLLACRQPAAVSWGKTITTNPMKADRFGRVSAKLIFSAKPSRACIRARFIF